jgi:hypothetical protein
LTGTFRTFHAPDSVAAALALRTRKLGASDFKLLDKGPAAPRTIRPAPTLGWIDARLTFRISQPAATCSGGFRLVQEGGKWKAWTFYTLLEQIDAHRELNPYTGEPAVPFQLSTPGPATRARARPTRLPSPTVPLEVDVLIFGGGGAGLSMAGRCEAWDLSHVIVDRYPKAGENWAQRYDKAVWHTPKYVRHRCPFSECH